MRYGSRSYACFRITIINIVTTDSFNIIIQQAVVEARIANTNDVIICIYYSKLHCLLLALYKQFVGLYT